MAERIYERKRPIYIYTLKQEIPHVFADKIIGRYFNLSGFLNMLKTSELRFKKISNFEDKMEGVPLYKETVYHLEQSEKNVGPPYAKKRKESIIKTIDNYYASCWTMKDDESYLMWKNYSSFDEGILVLTTVKQLLQSLDLKFYDESNDNLTGKTGDIVNCFFGEVDYNYQKNEDRTEHIKAFGKSKYFSDENEFRLVIYHHPIIEDDWFRCTIEDFSFINRIICSPKATSEFSNLIKRIVVDYSLPDSLVGESGIKQNREAIFDEFILKEKPSDN